MPLSGFSLDEVHKVTLEEDTEPKTIFEIRSLPQGKRDELRARGYDYLLKKERVGGDIVEATMFKREVVRWGVKRHLGGVDGMAECKLASAKFAGKEFEVLADETLDVYERTILAVHKLNEKGEPAKDGEPVAMERNETLLDRMHGIVQSHQTLSLPERRGLPGDDLARPG